jgi:hypothetical protein
MSQDKLEASYFSPDILEFIQLLYLLNQIDGVTFAEAWEARVTTTIQTSTAEFPLYYLGLPHLIRNKEACARPKDQDDLMFLRQLAP